MAITKTPHNDFFSKDPSFPALKLQKLIVSSYTLELTVALNRQDRRLMQSKVSFDKVDNLLAIVLKVLCQVRKISEMQSTIHKYPGFLFVPLQY